MKTKIALAATSAPATGETVSKLLQGIFGKPEKKKLTEEGERQSDWMKSSVQFYNHTDGTVGVYINVREVPTLEFDKVKPEVARKRIFSWAKTYAKAMAKQSAELTKRHNKLVSGLTAFASSPAELPKML